MRAGRIVDELMPHGERAADSSTGGYRARENDGKRWYFGAVVSRTRANPGEVLSFRGGVVVLSRTHVGARATVPGAASGVVLRAGGNRGRYLTMPVAHAS